MSYDPKDMMIWCTGLVGRAMGSGQFQPESISALTQAACAAFLEHLAPKLASAAPPPRPAPSAFQGPPRASAPQKPDWKGAAAGGNSIGAETEPFSKWGGDPARYGGRDWVWNGKPFRDVAWYELVDASIEGDQKARKALETMSTSDPDQGDPKYRRSNVQKIARAKACLNMVAQGKRATAAPPPDAGEAWEAPDETPFG